MEINNLVVKTNNLISGFMDMSKNEYKFVLYLVSKIKKDDKEFRKQRISVKEFRELLGYKGKGLHDYMKTFERSLISKSIIIISDNGNRLTMPWFGYLKYIEKEGIIEVAFNYDVSPFLLEIDVAYTKYYLSNVKGLSSYQVIRIYELLKQYQKIGERIKKIL